MNLQGKKGLIIGIANDQSIAWGCAEAFRRQGAALAVTYLDEKAEEWVRPLAERLGAELILPLDVRSDEQTDAVFYTINQQWGKLDFLLHAIAYAPKADLHGRLTDCSRPGFLEAMDISCYSFIHMAHHAAPLMQSGGCLLATSYYGSEKVIEHYNMMGPVKAALEGTVKYLAAELGQGRIRVNALSPGPILTRAASGIANFDELIAQVREKSPEHEAVTIDDVGNYAAFLVGDGARHITGNICYIDAGYHLMGG